MGFLGSLSRKLGFSMEEEDDRSEEIEDTEEEEDDEEEEEESAPRFSLNFGNLFQKAGSRRGHAQHADEEEDDESEAEPQPGRTAKRSNVIHDARMESRQNTEPRYTHCERIVNVRQMEECRDIIKYLLRGESILLNLENIDPKDCGRVVDLLSGAAFALQGRMLKVAHLSYLLAPENVEVVEEDVYGTNAGPRYR